MIGAIIGDIVGSRFEFSEAPIEVPITGRKTKLIIVSIILILVNIIFAIRTDFFKKLFKKSL